MAAQAEYATDVMFKTAEGLRDLYPQLLSHSTLCFGAKEVMSFLGRKLVGNFQGEMVSDLSSLVCRRTCSSRIKHRVKQNWLKMVDKGGLVLKIETVINNPEQFRVREQANARYVDALAAVESLSSISLVRRAMEASFATAVKGKIKFLQSSAHPYPRRVAAFALPRSGVNGVVPHHKWRPRFTHDDRSIGPRS